jgi:DNA-binding LacI/PurR family transcriptional regulator
MTAKLTQKQLAHQLGVSVATISRVLNDKPGVSDEIRERVLELMAQAGYAPNGAARSLATSRTGLIAFVVHQSSHDSREDPFYPFIVAGAESFLGSQQVHILFTSLDDDTMQKPQNFTAVAERRVDGLILAGPDISPNFILYHLSQGVPLVIIDNCLQNSEVNCVLNDDFGGEYQAARHLIQKGRRKIVFLSGPLEWVSSRERGRGYAHALSEAHLSPQMVYAAETTIASGEQAMAEALERWPDLDGVCAANDAMAIGAMRVLTSSGRRIPHDVAVFGFDDIGWSTLTTPPLSTVHVYKRQLGVLAAQRLLDVIADPELPPVKVISGTRLILRQSTGD